MPSSSKPHEEFWKRITFALVALLFAGMAFVWNGEVRNRIRNTEDIRAVVGAVSELTATVSSLAATVEAMRDAR